MGGRGRVRCAQTPSKVPSFFQLCFLLMEGGKTCKTSAAKTASGLFSKGSGYSSAGGDS